jgi:hypothetical protein
LCVNYGNFAIATELCVIVTETFSLLWSCNWCRNSVSHGIVTDIARYVSASKKRK